MKFKENLVPAGIVVLMLIASVVIYYSNRPHVELPVFGKVTDFNLTERSGKPITVKDLEGKVSIVNFFFANCTGPCPAMNAKVAELYRQYAETPNVQFVSITIDPDRDSSEALDIYAKGFNVTDRRWIFLRTTKDQVHHLAEKIFMVGGDSPSVHSTKLILVDASAQIRGFYSSEENASMAVLKTHIRDLAIR